MRKILLFLPLTFSIISLAQKPPAKFGDIPMEDMKMTVYAKDSSAEAVVLVDYGESSVSFNQNKGFQITFERLRRVKILTKEGLEWADFNIPLYHYSNQDEKISGLKVVTYNLEKDKIIEAKAKSESFLKEKYDESTNLTKVTWPNVKVGSILEITYKVTSDFLFNFQDWEFQTSIPTRLSEYRARIPEYFNYEKYMQGYIVLSMNEMDTQPNSITITHTQRSGGTSSVPNATTSFSTENISYQENRFRWAATEAPAFKTEPFITTPKDYISKINFELAYTSFPSQFSNPGKQYMGTWEDINRTYWDSVEEEITGSNSLKNQVETILTGITTSDEKLKTIFNYVRQNVLWDGDYRKYSENSPKKTFDEKKGSSAEINLLLVCLLEKAEFSASPVLLSTRNHGFVRETIPVSSQFNNVICVVRLGDKSILLDATNKFLPMGMIPEECLNGKGFVISKEGFKWISLQPTTKTKTIFSADLTLSESGELKGFLKIDKTGYNAVEARKSYLTKGEKNYISALSVGRSWTLSKSEFQNATEIQQPFKEVHEIVISEHITEAGNTIYLSPFILAKLEDNPFKQEKRNYPVDFGHSFDQMYLAKITLPDGYVVDELPKTKVVGLPENGAKYSYNIVQTGNTLNITSSLNINKSLFTQIEYPGLREFYNVMVAKQAEQIVLKKK